MEDLPAERSGSGSLNGPWLDAFWVELGFPLQSKSNFRRGSARSAGSGWKASQEFERSVGFAVRAALPGSWQMGERDAGVAQRPVVVVQIFADTMLDSGNLSKSVLDALEGVVFHTDASVAYSGSLARRTRTDQRSFLAIALLAPGASVAEIIAAQAALGTALLTRFDV